METDVAVYDGETKALTTLDFMPIMRPEDVLARHNALKACVQAILVKGHDYAPIPGTGGEKPKPVLLKPGAEKLTTFFGLSSKFELDMRIEDWSGEEHGGEPFFYYAFRCKLYRGDRFIVECLGSCNSHEKKYRYRNAERQCPDCGKETIRKSKKDGSWYCWAKLGGCGVTFAATDPELVEQVQGKIVNPDIADLVNTIQKMSQKRAYVGAVLLAVNASDLFTQDLDDAAILTETPPPESKPAPIRQPPETKKQARPPAPESNEPPLDLRRFLSTCESIGAGEIEVKQMVFLLFGIDINQATRSQGVKVYEALKIAKAEEKQDVEQNV